MMAEHPKEVCEITKTAAALMLNVGNITDARIESMMIALETAENKGIPVLLDAVGVACSSFRRKYVFRLLDIATPSVIKGNYSEIVALHNENYTSLGVDADGSLDEEYVVKAAKELALQYRTVMLATGKTDMITDGTRVVYSKNGTPELSFVTGTGCMLGSLCTAFMTGAKPMDASIAACCYFGICGELARTEKGNGSFMVNLMDRISTLGREEIKKYLKMEER